MAAPPPPPHWVVLRRFPCDDPPEDDGGISLALDAPPRITQLAGSPSLLSRGSVVLATDPSGVLLLSDSFVCAAADKPAATSYLLWDAVFKTSRCIPAPDTQAATAGLIVVPRAFGDYDIILAELVIPSADSDCALLRCFSMPTSAGEWITKAPMKLPPMKFPWRSSHMLSYRGKIFWVDLLQGLLACDPFADKPELHFVQLPSIFMLAKGNEQRCREGLAKDRCVNHSCGKLRLVVITRSTSHPVIKLWTLHDLHAGRWAMDYEVPLSCIFRDQSYIATGLPAERPTLMLVHPSNPHVVYFFLKQHLFGVDLKRMMVIDSASTGRDEPSNSLLAWELPPSLGTTSVPSREDHAFDTILGSFCSSYSHHLVNMAAQLFGELALGFLNKNTRNEEDKFKLSDHVSLCYFYEGDGTKQKKYAHLNFYAEASDQKKVLVFAELYIEAMDDACDDADFDDWTVSSCKVLSKNYHGDLSEESKGRTKRRKKCVKCYGCEADVLHPVSGFLGGYCGST